MATVQVCAVIFTGLFCCVWSNTTPPQGCMSNGHMYMPGQSFQPSPCKHCFCSPDGQTQCAVADCYPPPCVDAVHDPTKCCPECPNGENCEHSDGTIIKKGEVYSPDLYTTCKCPVNSWGMHGNMALCAVQMLPPGPTKELLAS